MSLRNEIDEILGIRKPKPPMAPKPCEHFFVLDKCIHCGLSHDEVEKPKPPKELHPPKPSVKDSTNLILEKLDLILSILNLNPEAIEKGLRRAKSTIHKKPEVEKGTGAYYKDYTEWTLEIDKLQEFKKNRQALMVELKERLKEVRLE